ncbi:MAG TPA: NAD(P)-dependent oxidoreductase [Stellaceae bacterium]|jgi:3-hydroxyisobutyrate dehydrogenase-like beta-hydroxyacid dehydrogenase
MEIGFLGLGNMGLPMARNLLKAGHAVTVYNRSPGKAEELHRDHGARVARTPAEAAAPVAVTMLADDAAVEAVVFGENGLLAALPKGAIHISMSTISVALSRRLAAAHEAAGQRYVAAPVFGRPDAAAAGKLFVVAAGAADARATCRPVFDAVGQKTFEPGDDPAAANVVKLSGNFLIAAAIESMGEAFALARKSGIDPRQYLDILTGTLFGAPVYRNYGGMIAEERYAPPGFKLPLGLKDVRLVLAAGDAAGVPMPVASLLHDRFLAGIGRGYGDLDWSALGKIAANDSGL